MTHHDWKAVAWYLEGEGYFGFTGTTAHVTAGARDPEPIQRLFDLLGGSLRQQVRRSQIKPLFDFTVWWATGERARQIMERVYPFMSRRRQLQIQLALTHSASRLD